MKTIKASPKLFRADFTVRINIDGCPERGLEALEYRRQHGLPERLDNRYDVTVSGDVSEHDFRRLVAAGFLGSTYIDGSMQLTFNELRQEFDPLEKALYGYRAKIRVSADDSDIDLACRALIQCRLEQWNKDHDIESMEDRLAETKAAYVKAGKEYESAADAMEALIAEREELESAMRA